MRNARGVLLLYHHELRPNANTIMQHVNAFEKHSAFKVWKVNTETGFPRALARMKFDVMVLHYSLFGIPPYKLSRDFLEIINHANADCIVALFQDEYRACQQRFNFVNTHQVDFIYTLVDPRYYGDTYRKFCPKASIRTVLPGYVADEDLAVAETLRRPDSERGIDIGYRARPLQFYMGRGAMEKTEIALHFKDQARNAGLRLDIEIAEEKRLYGDAWHKFLSDCRGMLGVESGVSVFDIHDEVYNEYCRILKAEPRITFEQFAARVLAPHEGRIQYRTIGPRNFEAAVFKVCQILHPGEYSGVLEKDVHYICLEKDFSNLDEVLEEFKNPALRVAIAQRNETTKSSTAGQKCANYGFDKPPSPRHVSKKGCSPVGIFADSQHGPVFRVQVWLENPLEHRRSMSFS